MADFGEILERMMSNPEYKAQAEKALGRDISNGERPLLGAAQEKGLVAQQEKGLVPTEATPEASQERDVTPQTTTAASTEEATPQLMGSAEQPKPGEPTNYVEANPERVEGPLKKGGLSLAQKIAIGGGGLGAGYFLMGNEKHPEQLAPTPASEDNNSNNQLNDDIDKSNPFHGREGQRNPAGSDDEMQSRGIVPKGPKASDMLSLNMQNDSSTAQQYRDERAHMQDAQTLNQLAAAGNTIGHAISLDKRPLDNSGFEQNIKVAQQNMPNIAEMQQVAESDPNSGMSRGLRDYAQKFGVAVPSTATAAQIKQVLPFLFKDFEAKQAQQSRQQDMALKYKELGLKRDEVNANKDVSRNDKQSKQDIDRFTHLNEKLTGDIASSRTTFGVAARNYQAVENAKALINGTADPNQLDNRQVFEMTRVLDRVLSQGNPTQFGAEHLNPDTARARLAKMMEFVTNQRVGSGAGDFVNNISHTMDREGQQALSQMQRTQAQLLSTNKDLAQKYPEKFGDMLEAHGLPRDILQHSKSYGQVYNSQVPADVQQAAAEELKKRQQGQAQ